MPQTPAPAAAKLIRTQIAFAVTAAPVTFGTAVICGLASNHLTSYWWLALTLGWAGVPLTIFVRMRRYARRLAHVNGGGRPSSSVPSR